MQCQDSDDDDDEEANTGSSESADSSNEHPSPSPLVAVQKGDAVVAVDLPRDASSPDRSDSTLESSDGGEGEKAVYDFEKSVLARWLGEKRVFAGMRRADNHDFKLIVRMKSSGAKP